jgi:nitroreductase/NAD-dependent dihydropyrimidine dehydrogenase PreA subunit
VPKVIIDSRLCLKDQLCAKVCPQQVIAQQNKVCSPEIRNDTLCISCGHCVAICPTGAIKHEAFPRESVLPIRHEMIPSFEEVIEMLRARRSIRAFENQPVERKHINDIIDGARYAPNAKNYQSTEVIVIQDTLLLGKIVKSTSDFYVRLVRRLQNPFMRRVMLWVARDDVEGALRLLPDFKMVVNVRKTGQDQILHNAPALLVFHAKKNISFSDVNANLALHNATLISQALGIGCFYAGYVVAACRRDRRIPQLLNIGKQNQVYGALALGYHKITFDKWPQREALRTVWL